MKPRVAIVCDWLTTFGGAERVIWQLHRLFPEAPIYTSIYSKNALPHFAGADVRTSFLQNMPLAQHKHQYYLPLLPLAFEEFDLNEYDIVISSSHSAAKGILTKPETIHICYCHTPMRYVWGNYHEYIREYGMPGFLMPLVERLLHRLRVWDRLAADRVDHFIANSKNIQRKVRKYYRHESEVIYPPCDTARFKDDKKKPIDFGYNLPDDYFLALGRIIPYKKFDLLVDTFKNIADNLVIAGEGKSLCSLKRKATPNITFLGAVPDEHVPALYRHARAYLFPQEEDFGITPLEAMASGTPVIAYAGGGALETVDPGKTGLLFMEQNSPSLVRALTEFSGIKWDRDKIRRHAAQFDTEQFNERIIGFIEKKCGAAKR